MGKQAPHIDPARREIVSAIDWQKKWGGGVIKTLSVSLVSWADKQPPEVAVFLVRAEP